VKFAAQKAGWKPERISRSRCPDGIRISLPGETGWRYAIFRSCLNSEKQSGRFLASVLDEDKSKGNQ
jgi:hypothetical protein